MIVILFGIQGVGKSSVVNKAKASFPEGFWTHMQLGDNAFDLAIQDGIIKIEEYQPQPQDKIVMQEPEKGIFLVERNRVESIYIKSKDDIALGRDYIRFINVQTTKILQKDIFDFYANYIKSNPDKNFLIETHAALKTKQGYLPGLSLDFLKDIQPDAFIIIEADAEKIFERRINDTTRKRDHDTTLKDVQKNLDITRYYASSYATSVISPLIIVDNIEGQLDETAHDLSEILKRFN